MCGIAGIFVGSAGRLDVCSIAGQMQSRLTHRGPDDHGLVALGNDRCVLAHTRLSILDLSPAGHQPMSTPDRRYWITYNGEIYNYWELRKELDGDREAGAVRGEPDITRSNEPKKSRNSDFGLHVLPSPISHERSAVSELEWHSNSDTEVILHSYARWGLDSLVKMRGMFAFAIWDNQKEELILARDPLGIKPLYYYQTEQFFIFASEVRALLAGGLVPRQLSVQGLESFLQFGSVQDPLTIVAGVHAVFPGQCLFVQCKNGALRVTSDSYAKITKDVPRPADRSEAVTALRPLLEESVRKHLVSDVPIGAFLSGGIDSSAIVALMGQVADQKPKTFSIVFKETEFSEAPYARLVAHRFGTEHREIMLSENNLLELLPSAFESMDQPTMDGINTYVLCKAVKEAGITVVLSGLGGDELFAGYPSFRRAQQLHQLAVTPSAIRRLASLAGRSIFNGSARRRKLWDMVESDCSAYAAYSISRQLFARDEVSALLANLRPATPDLSPHVPSSMLCALSALPKSDIINEVSFLELTGYMCNTLLRDTDQMSMAHALEVRVPFVDRKVVEFVLRLPGDWKLNGSRPKPLLLDALGDLLSEEVWRRPKMGFTLPFQRWMQSALEHEMSRILNDVRSFNHLGFSSDSAGAVWNAFRTNPQREPWSRSWALYVLKKWCEINQVTR